MTLIRKLLQNSAKLLPCLLALGLFAGCQTTPQTFRTPDAHWHTEIGQLQFSNPKRSIIGETVVTAFDHQEFQLDFLAGPGFPIIKLRRTGNTAHAESALARVAWNGKTEHPPGPLKSWLALADVFWQLNGSTKTEVALQSEAPGLWTAKARLNQGRPADVTVEFPKSKERFVFHFNQ